jgi:hypothetical protein
MPPDRSAPGIGRFSVIAFCAGLGLLVCSIANALSRSTETTTTVIYWVGLLLIVLPIFYRLTSRDASPRERLALVCLLVLSLYGVKVVRDSLLFTFPDEFVHAYNAEQIVSHHHLFHSNPLLPATPRYPGLEGATSALMTLTGMSSFGAGIIIVGTARLVFAMSLFFLFARLSGSARIAGLGVGVYTGSSNFLFWGAQFSYESLALPLLVLILMAFVEREEGPDSWRRAWLVPIVLGVLAVVLTHHMTSYALVLILAALALAYRLMRVPKPNPWPLLVFALVATATWLLLKAETTVGYLFPVLESAFKATLSTASGEAAPRTLFHASKTSVGTGTTPWFARLLALAAVALLVAGMLVGLQKVWRRHRGQPLPVIFCLASLLFFAALGLRFAPAAWETGNRAGEFLFLGLAFVISYALVWILGTHGGDHGRRVAVACGLGLVLLGGAISGWPWDAQLAKPIRVSAAAGEIESEPLSLARWASTHLPGRRFAAPEADGRLLATPGDLFALTGQGPDVEDIVGEAAFPAWQRRILRNHKLRYVVADRRIIAKDNVRGYFFTVPGVGDNGLLPAGVIHKFARLPAGRVYDSGRIVLFDLEDRP